MRAMVIRRHGGIDAIEPEDYPDPVPGAGEVVVAVAATALNYHDLFTLRGMPGIKVPLPMIMGIDVAGTIAAVGPDCGDWRVGERVLIDPFDRARYRLLGEMMEGGLAERVKVSADQLIRLDPAVPFAAAAALPVAYGTAYRMMLARGKVAAGEKVLILGASGGVGTCCVQLAKLAGAEVIACASSAEKLARLRDLGADHGIDYVAGDFMAEVHRRFGRPKVTGGGGVDVVVNFTGGDTWTPSLRCLTRGGRLLTCGATAGYAAQTDLRFLWTFEHTVLGSNGWERDDLRRLLDLVKAGTLVPVIDRTLKLEETREAFRLLDERKVFGKVIVTP